MKTQTLWDTILAFRDLKKEPLSDREKGILVSILFSEYRKQWKVIDGLEMHETGYNFKQWLENEKNWIFDIIGKDYPL